MKLNPEKYMFGVPAEKCLGFIIFEQGIEADPEKIKVIKDMPTPKSAGRAMTVRLLSILRPIPRSNGRKKSPFYWLFRGSTAFTWTPSC